MITITPESKSQLLCTRCDHSEDEHNWQTGPCNHKDYGLSMCGVGVEAGVVNCICYAFVSPLQ
jgi:hypothetical protein